MNRADRTCGAQPCLLPALILLAACGPEAAPPTDPEPRVVPTGPADTPPPPEREPEPLAPGGSGPQLQPMRFEEFSTVIEPGLGCSFALRDSDAALFVASAGDERSERPQGLVKLRDTLVPLRSDSAGGYQALVGGAGMRSEALSVRVDRAEGDGEQVGIETTRWPATLTVTQDEGGTTVYRPGWYSCGA